MKSVQSCLVVLTAFILISECRDIPEFIHICQRNEPNFLECFRLAGEKLRPYLATGVPEYNIPSLEPLVIEELITEESDGLRLSATDVKTWGCTDYFIREIKLDMVNQIYEVDMEIPLLRIEAHYNVAGKIMVMPIRGDGPMEANITNCKTKTFVRGELYEKDGDTYLRYISLSVKVDVGGAQIKIENLFNGDKLLNDIVNDTINKNISPFLAELMPVIEKALAGTFLSIANKIVEPFTYDQLFPN